MNHFLITHRRSLRTIAAAFLANLILVTASLGVQPGLQLWMNFDDGTVNDHSGNELHGTLMGGAQIVDDLERGLVLSLNGGTAHVPIPDPQGLLDFSNGRSASVAAWVFPNVTKNHNQIFAQGEWNDGASLALKGDTTPPNQLWSQGQGGGTAQRSDVGISPQEWTHVAVTFTYDEGPNTLQVAFYINGELTGHAEGGAPLSGGLNAPAGGGNTVGREQRGAGTTARWFFDGRIDDLQVYDIALDQEGVLIAMEGFSAEFDMPIAADFGSVRFIDVLAPLSPAPFELAPLHVGDTIYVDEAHTVTTLPGGLAGNFAFKTRNEFPQSVLEFAGASAQTYVDTNLDPATLEYPLSFSIWTNRFDDGTARNKVWGWFFDGGANRGELEIDTRGGANNVLRMVWWGGGRINAPLPPANQWVHLGVVITEESARLYVDGVYAGSLPDGVAPLPLVDGSDLWIGARANPANHEGSFSGWLRDWIVFDADIGDEGMQQLAIQNEIPAFDIIQHLPMNEMQGDVVFDSSPQQTHGDLLGPEWSTTAPIPVTEPDSYIGFVVDRDTTVYVAYDADAPIPGWIADHYTDSGMTAQTTGGDFKLWQKEVQAREHVMLFTPGREEGDNNYWVILSHGPEAITPSGDNFFTRSAINPSDWDRGPFQWTLTTGASSAVHEATMVTNIGNLDPERGFLMTSSLRVPRLQHAGDNAIGFILLGDGSEESTAAIRAEWLPHEAGGGSSLRLVDAASGTPLDGAVVSWTGLRPAAIDNDAGVGAGATEVLFGTGSAPFTDVSGAPLSETFADGGTGWTTGTYNATPSQWEIGVPTSGPGSAFVGQNVAATQLGGGYAASTQSWLRSPVVDLTDTSEASLRFHEYLDVDTFVEAGVVFHFTTVTVLDADTLQEMAELASYSDQIRQWSLRELDLAEFAGQRIIIEFALFSDTVLSEDWQGWYLDNIQVTGDGAVIVSMPSALAPDMVLNGISTENAGLADDSDSYLQFTVSDRSATGNDGVSVFVAWDIRASGLEPSWLRDNFTLTDHFIGVSDGQHRLWVREYSDGDTVTLGGASAGGGGPFPEATNNYFVLFGDARPGLETFYTLTAQGVFEEETWSIDFSLTDADGHSQTVSATIGESLLDRTQFGLFARHPDAAGGTVAASPIWEIETVSIGFLTTLPGFESWRAQHFPGQLDNLEVSGPDASPAGDGVKNLIKYALDLPPMEPVSSADLPLMDLNEEGGLILVYWERTDIDDIDYIPQVSEDLVNWESGAPHVTEFLRQAGSEAHLEEVGVMGEVSENSTRGFLRLLVRQRE